MQNKTQQNRIIDGAAAMGELHTLCWFGAAYAAGRESVIMLEDRTLPIVPMVPWPQLGCPRDQVELSRLLAEIMCRSMRRRLATHREILPAISSYDEIAALGVQWEEWQLVTVDHDTVCPHCGMVNAMPCCADWQPRRRRRKR